MSEPSSPSVTAKRIVVGYDGSSGATLALRHAAYYAVERGLGLTILAAHRDLDPTSTRTARALKSNPDYVNELRVRIVSHLDELCAQVRADHPGIDVLPDLVITNPAGALAAASQDAAFVVVGARGNSADRRAPVLGGISSAVIAHALGPVIVIPDAATTVPTPGPVVIGLQDAPDSLAAGVIAAAEAETRGVPLLALYAWDIAPELGDLGALARLDPVKTQHDLEQMLSELLEPLQAGHPDLVVERRVVQGSARAALVEASKDAGLIVIGSRGLGGFAGMLLGSISRSVTREAACPVMVVRYRGAKSEAPAE